MGACSRNIPILQVAPPLLTKETTVTAYRYTRFKCPNEYICNKRIFFAAEVMMNLYRLNKKLENRCENEKKTRLSY